MKRQGVQPLKVGPSDRVFVLTGAGISAESGLATFRGGGGLWEGERVEDVASPRGWQRDPVRVWRFYSQRRRNGLGAQPNAGHVALAEWEKSLDGRLFLCTQNVDNLHERAGSQNLVHMHGELFQSCCDSCNAAPFADTRCYESEAEIPRCHCGGRIRPNIVWFGEVPFHMDQIFDELMRCTMMLVIGTSGVVQPAASFVHWANDHHPRGEEVRTYYVGPEHPANASAFNEVFAGAAGEVLPRLFSLAR